MGNREECPACRACSSSVYKAIHFDHSDCPYCGCSYELLVKWSEMKPELESLKLLNIEKSLIKNNEFLQTENAKLKTNIKKMYDILAFRDINELFEPIIKVKNILEGNDDINSV